MEFLRNVYVNKLIERKQNGLIKIITGARRAGKSYLMNELYYKYLLQQGIPTANIIKFAFDSDEDIDLLDEYAVGEVSVKRQKNGTNLVNAKKFRAFIKERTNDTEEFYLLLDEVQLLENFVGTLNGFLRHKNFDMYVTGSNSRFLSSDIVTEFKGRGTQVHVLPLAFSEYVQGLCLAAQDAWKEYIETGGIPIVAKMRSKEEKIAYLKDLCEETYLKEIIEHNRVRKQEELADTFDVVASMIGMLFIAYFEDAFILSKARKYNIKGRKYIGSPYKLYFEDIGVRNARLNFRQIEEPHIMENIIYNELRYRGFSVDVGEVNISEKKQIGQKGQAQYVRKTVEVDFVATLGSQKYYLQSALTLGDPDKEMQEKKSLYHIDDSFQKIVITKNGLNLFRDEKGIIVVDLFEFLLQPEAFGVMLK